MLRVLCHCIDFIDFYSANLGLSALGRGVRQYSVTTRGGWGTILGCHLPLSQLNISQAQRRLRKTRGT